MYQVVVVRAGRILLKRASLRLKKTAVAVLGCSGAVFGVYRSLFLSLEQWCFAKRCEASRQVILYHDRRRATAGCVCARFRTATRLPRALSLRVF